MSINRRIHSHNSSSKSLYSEQSSKRKGATSRRSRFKTRQFKSIKREKIEKMVWTSIGFLGVVILFSVVWFLFSLQKIVEELPDIDGDAINKKTASSTIYDRNGTELYKVSSSKETKDYIQLNEHVPEVLKWEFISGEDEAFYEHAGVDFTAVTRCLIYRFTGGPICGGSTITQQLLLNTIISRDDSYVRKLKDMILALQLEKKYTKDEIMNGYLNIVPQGSGVIGVKTGASFYYHKELKDLSISEMTVLAAVVQNPSLLSPTVGSDIEANKKRLYARTDYILDQIIRNLDRVNEKIRDANKRNTDKDPLLFPQQVEITREELEAAKQKVRELEFQKPVINIKAPHFIFYVQELLKQRNYNNGKPFTDAEIQTQGLKIYTTLDYSLQQIAEEYVGSSEPGHAGYYRKNTGAKNSALMTLNPSTGEILTMVGSKCFNDSEYVPNCLELDDAEGDLFDPKVNVLNTLQSPGSTNKGIGYYIGFKEGKISTASTLPDVPIDINGYRPKNSTGGFIGMGDVRYVLGQSLNLPALFLLESYGVQKYIDTAREFGYTTYTSELGYGPSVILGGTDIKGIEHAQAFGVFANGGDFVQHEVIVKITDIDDNIIYEHKPEKVRVADPAAIYLVNNVLSPTFSGSVAPTKHMKDRMVAGKTGTSEDNKDTWYVMWSPEFVTVGWMGNNDNTRMIAGSFGSTSVEPWVGTYMDTIASAFPNKTPFERPAGVVSAVVSCDGEVCQSNGAGLAVAGKNPPVYLQKKTAMVCIDQPDRLAREIDISGGFAMEATFPYLQSPAPELQGFVDAYFGSKEGSKGIPTEYCDIQRTDNPDAAGGIIISPQPGQSYSGTMLINARAFIGEGKSIKRIEFELGGKSLATTESSSYSETVDISNVKNGLNKFNMVIYDNINEKATYSVSVYVGSTEKIGTLSLNTSPEVANGTSSVVSAVYNGARSINAVSLYEQNTKTGVTTFVGNMRTIDNINYEYNWAPSRIGEYNVYAVAELANSSLSSNSVNVKVGKAISPTPAAL